MLSLHKKIQSNWKEYANMTVPVKVLRLLPWKTPHLLSIYKYRRSEREINNNNILCLFLQKLGLIVKFYKSLYVLLLLDIFYGFNR